MKNFKIITIGYEGRSIDEFVFQLKNHVITRLIDVREVPLSRKKGFSKSALKCRLESEGIEYIHLRSLGSPAKIRNKLKMDSDYYYFFEAYKKHLLGNQDAILEAYQYIINSTSCMMCFERGPEKCHRYVAAEILKEYEGNGLKITHIV